MNRKTKTSEELIFCRKETKRLLAAALISLLVLMAIASRGARLSRQEMSTEQRINEWAWWGCLYPGICLESAMCLVEESGEQGSMQTEDDCHEVRIPGQELPVKIKWKCMDLF